MMAAQSSQEEYMMMVMAMTAQAALLILPNCRIFARRTCEFQEPMPLSLLAF